MGRFADLCCGFFFGVILMVGDLLMMGMDGKFLTFGTSKWTFERYVSD